MKDTSVDMFVSSRGRSLPCLFRNHGVDVGQSGSMMSVSSVMVITTGTAYSTTGDDVGVNIEPVPLDCAPVRC